MVIYVMRGMLLGLSLALFLLQPPATPATEIKLAGANATWQDLTIITNSVRGATVLNAYDHTIVSTSSLDTCLAFLPSWGTWHDVPDGTLEIWVETINDSSNAVAVLLGDPETPSLTIACQNDWSVMPAGTFPQDEPIAPRFGATTNRLHLILRTDTPFGKGRIYVETQTPGGSWTSRPDLALTDFGWLDAAQDMPNWSKVGVWTAGPQAALTELRLLWCRDGTIYLIK